LIPEKRYPISRSFLDQIRSRGFEVNVHDLNHDGRLFANEAQFRSRAKRINGYAKEIQALGFRSAVLYRNMAWCDALQFRYDMSVPNVGHLDPQPGGCCTVMPYRIRHMTEIPLTTTQDYTLFYILGVYSIDLWRQQLQDIFASHGIATFNVHPDYIRELAARCVYIDLLRHISDLHGAGAVWLALPAEVDSWWRNRARMRLVRQFGQWQIEGPQSSRARLAYAVLRNGQLRYTWNSSPQAAPAAIGIKSAALAS
jgi:hypothetical protein